MNNGTKMRLRSSVPPEEKKKPLNNKKENKKPLPYIEFKGSTKYYTDMIGCAMACDELLTLVNRSEELSILGFDLEWPFSWKTGPGKTAVVQIQPNLDLCYILHISQLKSLPKGLCVLLGHSKVRLVGVNIKNDVRKLARDFNVPNVEEIITNCVDLGVYANTMLPVTQRWSLEKLVNYCLKMGINKDKKVRMSQWAIIPLSEEQKLYAATDTFASLKLYSYIQEFKPEKTDDLNAELKKLI